MFRKILGKIEKHPQGITCSRLIIPDTRKAKKFRRKSNLHEKLNHQM